MSLVNTHDPNPFSTCYVRPGAIPFVFNEDEDLPTLTQAIIQNPRSLIVGPHGSGKSTLIQTLLPELQAAFPTVCKVQLHATDALGLRAKFQHRRECECTIIESLSSLSDQNCLLIVDGLEQLGALGRARIVRIARQLDQTLLATSHSPIRSFQVIFQTRPTADLILGLTQRVLEKSSPQVRKYISRSLAAADLTKVSDVRSLWFDFYDQVADLASQPKNDSQNSNSQTS